MRFGVAGVLLLLLLLLLFSFSSNCAISGVASRRRLQEGAGGGVYWLLRPCGGPCDGYLFCFWGLEEYFHEDAVNDIGLSRALLVDRDVVVAVDRGRVFVRRDWSALQAAKIFGEDAVGDWQAARGGARSSLRAVEAFAKAVCDCISQESAEGRSMAGCVEIGNSLALSGGSLRPFLAPERILGDCDRQRCYLMADCNRAGSATPMRPVR